MTGGDDGVWGLPGLGPPCLGSNPRHGPGHSGCSGGEGQLVLRVVSASGVGPEEGAAAARHRDQQTHLEPTSARSALAPLSGAPRLPRQPRAPQRLRPVHCDAHSPSHLVWASRQLPSGVPPDRLLTPTPGPYQPSSREVLPAWPLDASRTPRPRRALLSSQP